MTERWVNRSCPICEAGCGLRLQIDPAARKVLHIEGDPDDPRSAGHICPKAFALSGVYTDRDRIRRPLRRIVGKGTGGWEEIGWDEALDYAASRLFEIRERFGSGGLGVYIGNPTGFDVGALFYNGALMAALQTTRIFSSATMDHQPKLVSSRAMYGKSGILPIPDIDRTDYFLCLGGNPIVSQGSLMSAPDMRRRLRAIQDRGGKVVVLDPRRTETARIADQHIFIKPGTDAFFLFALVNVFFAEGLVAPGRLADFTDGIEEVEKLAEAFTPEAVASATGIAPEVTRRIAREFAARARACCYGRIGTCTVEFGTLASWLIDVVGILTGHFDAEGGMMFPRSATGQGEAGSATGPFVTGRWRTVARGLPEIDGQLPSSALAEEIDSAGDDRIRALLTVAGNPVLSTASGARLGRALEGLDFMLCVDIYLNETTRHADLILPTAAQLEHENFDVLLQGTSVRNFVRYTPQVFDRADDAKPHWEVFLELAARLGGTTVEALDEQITITQAARHLARPNSPAYGVEVDTAIAATGNRRGPMRLIDLMLRAGPYGDGFDDAAPGLNLEKVISEPHAIDLGPLEPRMPEILRTEKRRIALAHEHIVADVGRLRAGLAARSRDTGLLLVGRRQARGMNSWLHNVDVLARGRSRCTLLIHSCDAVRLGVIDGERARVRSRVGEVLAEVEVSDEMMPGVVSLPHGFGHTEPETRLEVASRHQPGVNANVLTDEGPLDVPSGTSVANGIPVEVSAA